MVLTAPLDCNGSVLTGLIIMKKKDDPQPRAVALAAQRVAEIERLSRDIRRTLEDMRTYVRDIPNIKPKDLADKLDQIHAAHLRVLRAEDILHEKIGKDSDAEAIDYDAIRLEIGRQLDRLRESLVAEGIHRDTDGGAA